MRWESVGFCAKDGSVKVRVIFKGITPCVRHIAWHNTSYKGDEIKNEESIF